MENDKEIMNEPSPSIPNTTHMDRRGHGVVSHIFNSSYDMDIITKNIHAFKGDSYRFELEEQKDLCDISIMYGSRKDFRINPELNAAAGFPYTTYSLRIQNDFLRLYTNNLLLRHYNIHEKIYQYPTEEPFYAKSGSRVEYNKETDKLVNTKIRLGFQKFPQKKISDDPEQYANDYFYSYNGKNRIFSLSDTYKYREFFRREMLFFIGNRFIGNLRIIPFKGFSYLVLIPSDTDGLSYDILNDMFDRDDKWTLLLLPHSTMIDTTVKVSDILNEENISIPLSTVNFEYINLNEIEKMLSGKKPATFMTFISSNDDKNINSSSKKSPKNTGYMNPIITTLDPEKQSPNGESLTFSGPDFSNYFSKFDTSASVRLFIFSFHDLIDQINMKSLNYDQFMIRYDELLEPDRLKETNPFIEDYLPIMENMKCYRVAPPENLLAIHIDPDSYEFSLIPDTKFTIYYPYFYQIENYGDDRDNTNIFVFGTEFGKSKNRFIDILNPYIEYLLSTKSKQDVAYSVTHGNIPDVWKKYSPPPIEYSASDYEQNIESLDPVSPFGYSLEKFINFIDVNPIEYSRYFKQIENTMLSHETTYEYDALEIRSKMGPYQNNHEQISDEDFWVDFGKDMYCIPFNQRTNLNTSFSLFIDGKMVLGTSIHTEGFMKYIYFPATAMNAESDIITLKVYSDPYDDRHFGQLMIDNGDYENPHAGDRDVYYIKSNENVYIDTVNEERLRVGYFDYSDEVDTSSPGFPGAIDNFSPNNIFGYIIETGSDINGMVINMENPENQFKYEAVVTLTDIEKELLGVDENELTLNSTEADFKRIISNQILLSKFDLAAIPELYTTEYTDTTTVFDQDAYYREFDTPHIRLRMSTTRNANKMSVRVFVDDEEITNYHRYYIDDSRGNYLQYIFIPKKSVSASSKIIIQTLRESENAKFGQFTFTNTPSYRIKCENELLTNINIAVKPCDVYASKTLTVGGDRRTLLWDEYALDQNPERIRVWKFVEENDTIFGLLVSSDEYKLLYGDRIDDPLEIVFKTVLPEKSSFFVEHIPYPMHKVHQFGLDNSGIYTIPPDKIKTTEYMIFADGKLISRYSVDYTQITANTFTYRGNFTTMDIYIHDVYDSESAIKFGESQSIIDALIESESQFKTYLSENY